VAAERPARRRFATSTPTTSAAPASSPIRKAMSPKPRTSIPTTLSASIPRAAATRLAQTDRSGN